MGRISQNGRDFSILFANFFDHFDTTLYSLFAPVLAPLFFPEESRETGLFYLFGVFFSATCMRPLGVIVFGSLSRRSGFEASFFWALIGLGCTTCLVGLLPFIGKWSWIFLFFCRGFGAFFAAGEAILAPLLLVFGKEEASAYRWSYWYKTSTMLGILVASIVCSSLANWWQYVFLFGGCFLMGFALFVRRQGTTPPFQQKDLRLGSLWDKKGLIVSLALLSGTSYLTYALVFVFLPVFAPIALKVSQDFVWRVHPFLMGLDFCCIPLLGWGTERLFQFFQWGLFKGYKNVLSISALGLLSLSIVFGFFSIQGEWECLLFQAAVIVCGVFFCLPLTLYKLQWIGQHGNTPLFLGIANSLGTLVIGRSFPMIGMALWIWQPNLLWIGGYLALWFSLSFYVVFNEKLKGVAEASLPEQKAISPI